MTFSTCFIIFCTSKPILSCYKNLERKHWGERPLGLRQPSPITFAFRSGQVVRKMLDLLHKKCKLGGVRTLYNAILRIPRNFLETRENIKISTHPFYRTLYFLLFLFSYALIFFNFENRRFSKTFHFSPKLKEIQKKGIQLSV